jgi:hypothetical protein
MSLTVGLDFGTHQTKVCVEDSRNPLLKRYTFFPFEDRKGQSSYVLPSVVQINNDDTLSYGFVDEANAKVLEREVEVIAPFLFPKYEPAPQPTKPALKPYPAVPPKARRSFSLSDLASLLGRDEKSRDHRIECQRVDQENRQIESSYKAQLSTYLKEEEKRKSDWESRHEEELNRYRQKVEEVESHRFMPLRFRYFKTAALGDNRYWEFDTQEYNPRLLSVLYLAYVLYQVESDFGADTYVQMGVPQSLGTREGDRIEGLGYQMLILARKLTSERSKSDFTSLKYSEFIQLVDFDFVIDDDVKNEYGVNILPEAYAGLIALTAQRRIPNGFSLLVDIGGGTTDIALFTLANDQRAPDISKVVSLKGGLNSMIQRLSEVSGTSMTDVQKSFANMINTPSSLGARELLRKSLLDSVGLIVKELFAGLQALGNANGPTREALATALNSRPIYYCGGGGVYGKLRTPLSDYFSDVRQVSLHEMGIQNLTSSVPAPFDTILAVSYGLSILSDTKLESTPISQIFKHLRNDGNDPNFVRDYND